MQKPRQTTIIDIAKQLGVAPSTVSRALRDHPSISAQTKQKVISLAEEHSYQPNLQALSLLNKKTGLIGIIVPEITSYYFATVISAVQDVVSPLGYKLLICASEESFEMEKQLLQDMILLRVDGMLVSPTYRTTTFQHFDKLQKAGIPLVIFDRDCPGFEGNRVMVDSYDGAYQAVQYLIKAGCRQIAHIAGPTAIPTFQQRLDGYLDAHSDNKLPVCPELLVYSNGFFSQDGVEAATTLLSRQKEIDAVFAVIDGVAIGAAHLFRERGYRIPDDISIVGFDDESYAQHFSPPLSTVWQPVYELGMLSAKILLDGLAGLSTSGTYRYEVLKPELVIRGSSVPVPQNAEAL